jgi:hypothetical protein
MCNQHASGAARGSGASISLSARPAPQINEISAFRKLPQSVRNAKSENPKKGLQRPARPRPTFNGSEIVLERRA